MYALTKHRGTTTVGHMGNPEDELVDLLGDKPDGVVEISEQLSNETSHDRARATGSPSACRRQLAAHSTYRARY